MQNCLVLRAIAADYRCLAKMGYLLYRGTDLHSFDIDGSQMFIEKFKKCSLLLMIITRNVVDERTSKALSGVIWNASVVIKMRYHIHLCVDPVYCSRKTLR